MKALIIGICLMGFASVSMAAKRHHHHHVNHVHHVYHHHHVNHHQHKHHQRRHRNQAMIVMQQNGGLGLAFSHHSKHGNNVTVAFGF
jgi:hypothetical protein